MIGGGVGHGDRLSHGRGDETGRQPRDRHRGSPHQGADHSGRARLRATSDELFVMTDDGSYGEHGFVTQKLQQLLDGPADVWITCLAIGPIPMMQAVAEVTRPHGIRTIVSLNPIMVDGTGMCGGCRVLVGGRSQFACVDGPEFDAHEVDFHDPRPTQHAVSRTGASRVEATFEEHPQKGEP